MGIANKYNKQTIDWGINTDEFMYKPLSDLGEGEEITVRGLYINTKSRFGDAPVLIASDCYYNLPGYMTETVKEMLADEELVDAIKEGKVGAKVRRFIDKTYGKESFTVDWFDI